MGPKKSHASAGHMIHLVCPHCAKEFSGNSSTSGVRSNFRRHLLIHTGERPFPCPYCNESFSTKPNRRRHIAAHHPMLLTPPNKPQEDVGGDGDVPLVDLAPLALPRATAASSSPAADPAPSRRQGSGAEAASADTNGRDSASTDPESVSALTVGGTQQEDEQKPAKTFICDDCELEVSSRTKLRRHQRYYCPFRDDIFTDPVQDAVDRYRAEQQQLLQEEGQGDHGEDEDEESGYSSVDSASNALRSRSSTASPSHRRHGRRRQKTSVLALTEEEKNYLTRVAAQSGLKFVEDAYASEGSSDWSEEEKEDADSFVSSSASSAVSDMDELPPRGHRGRDDTIFLSPKGKPAPSPTLSNVSPRRTPLHGPLPSPKKKTTSPSPGLAPVLGGVREQKEREDVPASGWKQEEADVDPGEDLLHLHFHRRGSGHRRERHILQKRLRAQESALLALTNSPLRRPHKAHRLDPSHEITAARCTDGVAQPSVTAVPLPPPLSLPAQSVTTPIVVSEQMMARAEGLLTLERRQSCRSKANVSNEFVCPYCNEFRVFSSKRLLTAHSRRMHPVETARDAARAAEKRPASSNGFSP